MFNSIIYFFCSYFQRFNVAITRAQALLILIGNPDMLCLDENWKRLAETLGIFNLKAGIKTLKLKNK